MKPFKGYIKDWHRVQMLDGTCIRGVPVGHPKFVDWIFTTAIQNEYMADNGIDTIIQTRNSRYILMGKEKETPSPFVFRNESEAELTNPTHGGKVTCCVCGGFINTQERYIRRGDKYEHLNSQGPECNKYNNYYGPGKPID